MILAKPRSEGKLIRLGQPKKLHFKTMEDDFKIDNLKSDSNSSYTEETCIEKIFYLPYLK